ncbi:signal transduction protein [Paenibacillus sp. CAA11]|uniref:DUF294 nucleotidyltransferase-like domain-containing protein n=1 Tax=Paenibacillus sp. CAA11 TaxID=1532905 RepID=UPI000D3600E5|nr:DUF294 nucleotidyltransferase-like domain-containing protein [Paenibacillus sp. CAA11]AWB44164.1 signal transduction protein [Paenibacillus sp. CAA11]
MDSKTAYDHVDFAAIRSAASLMELGSARTEGAKRLLGVFSSVPIETWNESVNLLQDEVMSRAVFLCERDMAGEGWGVAPAPFAFVVFGSGGRGEQTLWSDQDNGLIISDTDDDVLVPYFAEFGKRLSSYLESAGYPPCEGKVMANNPMWSQTGSSWVRQLSHWTNEMGWEDVRYLTIASDMRHIVGPESLSEAWRQNLMNLLSGSEEIEAALLRNTMRHKAATNILGQIITERFGEHAGEFDIKYGLYIPLVNGIRCLAFKYGIKETSTLKRISRLYELEAFPRPWLDACRRAFHTALKFRSMTGKVTEQGQLAGSAYLSAEALKDKQIIRELRENLGAVRQLYRMLQRQHRFAERRRP